MSMSRREMLALGISGLVGSSFRFPGALEELRWPAARHRPRASFEPDVELALTARPSEAAILEGRRTGVLRFSGEVLRGPGDSLRTLPDSHLGPTLRFHRGQKVRIRFRNGLSEPSIVHWHGLDVPEAADGHPRFSVPGGGEYVYEFEVTNRAGTYWYHPHPHMQTGPQVYRGLAGLLIVTDDEDAALGLPSGDDDLLCVLQDRRFDDDNQLVYSTSMMDMETGMLGDRVLVNGRPDPTWSLATRAYRLRVLNGSNARIYKLAWSDGTPLTVIGTDGGLLQRPLTQQYVTLAPAQRVELWLDLSDRPVGSRIELRSAEFELADGGLDMGRMGGMGGMGRMGMGRGAGMGGRALPQGAPISLVTFEVGRRDTTPVRPLPERLSTFGPEWDATTDGRARRIPLTFRMMEWMMAGRVFEMDGVEDDETVVAGSTHVWEFVNSGGPMGMQMAHPIHVHGRQFRVVGRSGGDPANTLREGLVDSGWTDTVLVLPGESVRIRVPFTTHPGLYLYHCHILEHEDMGMMRNYRIVAR
jgi:FtsP/CotA-like multicopper oxidase with cupredoxin domain